MDKQTAFRILKSWATDDRVMIRDRSWVPGVYFPDFKNSIGHFVTLINGDAQFYFDDNEFVMWDKTIIVVQPDKTTTREFFNRLRQMQII